MADEQSGALPKGWIRKESKSKPGRFYYSNKKTGVSVWRLQQVLAADAQNSGGSNTSADKSTAKDVNHKKVGKSRPIGTRLNEGTHLSKDGSRDSKRKQITEGPHQVKQAEQNKTEEASNAAVTIQRSSRCTASTENQKTFKKQYVGKAVMYDRRSGSESKTQISSATASTAGVNHARTTSCQLVPSIATHRIVSKPTKCTRPSVTLQQQGGKAYSCNDDRKIEEQADKFEKLVAEAALKKEYIDLEMPVGTKHVRPVRAPDKPSRSSTSTQRCHRYTPLSLENVKEIVRQERKKRSKSDTNLLFGKPRRASAHGGIFSTPLQVPRTVTSSAAFVTERCAVSSTALQLPAANQPSSGVDQSQAGKYRESNGSTTPASIPSLQNTVTSITGTPITGTPITGTPITAAPITGTPITGTPITGTPITGTPITGTPITGTPIAGTPITGTPITGTQTIGPLRTAAPGTVAQRIHSYSLEDDWDMVSEEEEGDECGSAKGEQEIALVSFALSSDVVMSCSSQADSGTGRRADSDVLYSTLEPSVCLVMDTCSMGNLQSLLAMRAVELPSSPHSGSGVATEHTIVNIIIPWQVLQEIDFLKDNKGQTFSTTKSLKARRVARLIHTELSTKSTLIKLQSPMDDATEFKGFRIVSEDDHIIKCCLSLKSKIGSQSMAVILVTEDINLINKCFACALKANKFEELVFKWRSNRPRPAAAAATVSTRWREKMLSHLEIPMSLPATPPPKAIVKPYSKYAAAKPNGDNAGSPSSPTQLTPLSNVSQLAASHSAPKTSEEIRHVLNELEAILKPVLAKCLVMEMCEVFGEAWIPLIYRKPPWDSLLPILESLNKHWIAVFGMVVTRHTNKFVKSLMDTYSSRNVSSDRLLQAIISATSLCRALDKVGRSYSPEARASLPKLSELLGRCQQDLSSSNPNQLTESIPDVGAQLTSIFSKLAAACEGVEDAGGATQAVEVVLPLGIAYNSAMALPSSSGSVSAFLEELNKLAELMSVKVEMSCEHLSQFIHSNGELMMDGLSQLEHIALALQRKLCSE